MEGEPSEDATAAVKEVQDKGVLIGAGFIAGESLMGVLLAIFIVAEMDPSSWFGGIGTLSYTISSILWMVRRSFHNVISTCTAFQRVAEDLMYVAADAAKVTRVSSTQF